MAVTDDQDDGTRAVDVTNAGGELVKCLEREVLGLVGEGARGLVLTGRLAGESRKTQLDGKTASDEVKDAGLKVAATLAPLIVGNDVAEIPVEDVGDALCHGCIALVRRVLRRRQQSGLAEHKKLSPGVEIQ